MKSILKTIFFSALLVFAIGLEANCQRVNPYEYINVDTIVKYDDADVIIYKNKFGKPAADTIYHAKQKKAWSIEFCDVMIIEDRKLKQYTYTVKPK